MKYSHNNKICDRSFIAIDWFTRLKIVIDTTVFGQGFNSRSADVRLLKSFLERKPAELCVPAIVLDEAVNLVRKSVEDVNLKLEATHRLTGDHAAYPKLDVKAKTTAYRESLDLLLNSLKARVLPYPTVSHPDLVTKALAPTKPFVSSGRGYRDALIWFSVLELAGSCNEEISFISANTDDWCHSKKDLRLHGDLLSDMNNRSIGSNRLRFFPSLGEFTQECAISTLPVSTEPAGATVNVPNYLQLLIDGKEWVETILADALPDFLKTLSRADARVGELEMLGISAPTNIEVLPIRVLDSERRLLQFSAEYRIVAQFLITRSDIAVWSQCVALRQRQEWDEARLRVQATMGVRVSFHMIERGEMTEGFSIVSISPTDGEVAKSQGQDSEASSAI
jgi:hypothetical protein